MVASLKISLKIGFYGGLAALFFALIGMIETFAERTIITGVISLGHALLIVTGLVTGFMTARLTTAALNQPLESARSTPGIQLLLGSLLAGFAMGLILVIFIFVADQMNLRPVLVNVSPTLLGLLTFYQGIILGPILLAVLSLVSAVVGGLFYLLPLRFSRPLVWGLAIMLLAGMLFDLLRITLSRPGWPTALSKILFAPRGLSITGAIIVFVVTIGFVLARPYLPGLYQRLLQVIITWLPVWFRYVLVILLSLSLGLRLIWFISTNNQDLPFTPACGEQGLFACLGNLGAVLDFQPGQGSGLAAQEPTLLSLITLAELLLVSGVGVAIVLLVVQGLRWRQLPPVSQAERLPAPAMLERTRQFTMIYLSIALLLFIPILLGSFPSEVMVNVGIYVVMGLGLNIVVGFAGLLDLGYVAFFAVGAYTTALLTSPTSTLHTNLTFWEALPFVFVITAIAGLLVGGPVLRMRGDYLAIVTLGLGEIARFLALSDWLKPYLGGAQGILNIPKPIVAGVEFAGPQKLYYLLLLGALVALFISWRLKDSRIGRAWMAMREDEDVADTMGINTIQYKLMAFAMGATIASFSGAVFAAKIGSVFPHSFNVLVSITALSLLIIGGIGSLPGVIVGALALVGIPELLREFTEYRLLLYGAVLIIMMLTRPEGLLPSRQRARELHDEERSQDAWLRAPQPTASILSTNPGSSE